MLFLHFFVLNNFLKSKKATNTPKAINKIAKINCSPDVKKSKVPVVIHAFTMLYTERPSELKVTTSIVHIGMYNINPFRPVTFRKQIMKSIP